MVERRECEAKVENSTNKPGYYVARNPSLMIIRTP